MVASGNTYRPRQDFCLTVHYFRTISSSSRTNFGLTQAAKDNSKLCDSEIVEIVETNFYMNKSFKSVESEAEALQLYHSLTDVMKQGGFHLIKWISGSETVLKQILEAKQSTSTNSLYKDVNLQVYEVKWNFISENFQFDICVKEKP